MKKFFEYIGLLKYKLTIVIVLKLLATIIELFIPVLLGFIIDKIVPEENIGKVFVYGGLMLICTITSLILNIIANRSASLVAKLNTEKIRHDLFKKIMYLSSKQIDSSTIPSLVSRMTSDTYYVHQMTGMMQRMGIRAPVLLIGGLVISVFINPIMTLVMVSILPFVVIATYLVTKRSIPLFGNVQVKVDNMVRVIRENSSGSRVIKALGNEKYEIDRFKVVNDDVYKFDVIANTRMAILNPIVSFFLNLGFVLVIIMGAYLTNKNGSLMSGVINTFNAFFLIILNAIIAITRIFISYSQAAASMVRINKILSLEEEIKVEDLNANTKAYLKFDNVSFSYNKVKNNIEKINFTVEEGEVLGIIGATGSGKTTLMNLLLRFYDIDDGEIVFKDKNIKSFNTGDLRKNFGTVLQNDLLFNDTVYENVNFGRNISIEQVNFALKIARADEFVNTLTEGINTVLNPKATNLSGGQKQRILIARALASLPEILILDDSSSALDYKTDYEIRNALKVNKICKTSIIISQRISSIRHANKIILLDKGKIVGYGNHNELLQNNHLYRKIYNIQMGETYE